MSNFQNGSGLNRTLSSFFEVEVVGMFFSCHAKEGEGWRGGLNLTADGRGKVTARLSGQPRPMLKCHKAPRTSRINGKME